MCNALWIVVCPFGHCVAYLSSIYEFRLPLWCLQNLVILFPFLVFKNINQDLTSYFINYYPIYYLIQYYTMYVYRQINYSAKIRTCINTRTVPPPPPLLSLKIKNYQVEIFVISKLVIVFEL